MAVFFIEDILIMVSPNSSQIFPDSPHTPNYTLSLCLSFIRIHFNNNNKIGWNKTNRQECDEENKLPGEKEPNKKLKKHFPSQQWGPIWFRHIQGRYVLSLWVHMGVSPTVFRRPCFLRPTWHLESFCFLFWLVPWALRRGGRWKHHI